MILLEEIKSEGHAWSRRKVSKTKTVSAVGENYSYLQLPVEENELNQVFMKKEASFSCVQTTWHFSITDTGQFYHLYLSLGFQKHQVTITEIMQVLDRGANLSAKLQTLKKGL